MQEKHNYSWRVKTRLVEGISRRTSTIDCQLYINKRRSQFAWHSYNTLANLTDHYYFNHYADLTAYSTVRDGMRVRQCRFLAKSDTFSCAIAGDIAIATTHAEIIVRYKRVLQKSQTAKRLDATATQLSNYALKALSQERRYECMARFNTSQLQELYGIASQAGNEMRGQGVIQTHQILFTHAPADYAFSLTPLDSLLGNIRTHMKNLARNHKRYNFEHSAPHVQFLKSEYSDHCVECGERMPATTSPPSLLELTSMYVHRRLAIVHHSAFLQKQWLDKLGIPEILKRMIYDYHMMICLEGKGVGACNTPSCSTCTEYRQCFHRAGVYIDNSNSELRNREFGLKMLASNQYEWPLQDFGEVGTIFKSYPMDQNKFVYNLVSNTFMLKSELHGQTYHLEVTDGATPIQEDEAGMQRIRNRVRAMLTFTKTKPDLRFSLKRSEAWVFIPIDRKASKDSQYYRADVSNWVEMMNKWTYRNYKPNVEPTIKRHKALL